MTHESRGGPLLGNVSESVSVITASGNMHPRDKASLSTFVTAGLICVPVTTDTQITTDEYTYC
jgi:hypothetical protein